MKQNFKMCLGVTLGYEGGVSDHPKDPGGLTNKGVTQRVYEAYRLNKNLPARSVREISPAEVEAIYNQQYWSKVMGDALPYGLDLVMFDYAVNSGVGKAVKDLQRVVGVGVDGIMGAMTLEAVAKGDPEKLIHAVCDRRLAFMKTLRGWRTFGAGWTTRVAGIRARGLSMVLDTPQLPPPATVAPAKAVLANQSTLRTPEGAGLTSAAAGAGGQQILNLAQQVSPHITQTIFGRLALAVFLVMMLVGGLLMAYSYMKRIKEAGGLNNFFAGIFK